MKFTEIDPGIPYTKLERNVRLLRSYIKKMAFNDAVLRATVEQLHVLAREVGRKPTIGFWGSYDAGKTTLINALLGRGNLPTSLQPTTSLPACIRHINDRPQWMHDQVWIMKSSFNPALWEDQQHCLANKLQGGDIGILRDYGTHQGTAYENGVAFYALVFLDAPILNACNLLDVPGYDNDDSDNKKANAHTELGDVIFYISPINGFLKSIDLTRIGRFIDILPAFELVDSRFPILGNLFILASFANPDEVGPEDIDNIFSTATKRLMTQIGETSIKKREELIKKKITNSDIKQRMYSFWSSRRGEKQADFCDNLTILLENYLPVIWSQRASNLVDSFKSSADTLCGEELEAYKNELKELADLEKRYKKYLEQEPARKEKVRRSIESMRSTINSCRSDSIREIRAFYQTYTSSSNLESILKSRYDKKSEAQEYALGYVVEKLQAQVGIVLKPKMEVVGRQTATFLESYKSSKYLSGEKLIGVISFNEASAFTEGLAKAGTALAGGAFASWAVGMGGAWLAAHTTGLAAGFGGLIATLGGAAAAGFATALSMVVAPLGIGVLALGVLAILDLWRWHAGVAKKINQRLVEVGFLDKIEQSINQYWSNSSQSFEQGSSEVERQWQEKLTTLRRRVENPEKGRIDIQKTIAVLEEGKDFFSHLPWDLEDSNLED
jgi:ribosome biogenesis GTPase A